MEAIRTFFGLTTPEDIECDEDMRSRYTAFLEDRNRTNQVGTISLAEYATARAVQQTFEGLWGIQIRTDQLLLLKAAIQRLGLSVPSTLYRPVLLYALGQSEVILDGFDYGLGRILQYGGYLHELQRNLQECRASGTDVPLWLLDFMGRRIIVDLGLPANNPMVIGTITGCLMYSTPEDAEILRTTPWANAFCSRSVTYYFQNGWDFDMANASIIAAIDAAFF